MIRRRSAYFVLAVLLLFFGTASGITIPNAFYGGVTIGGSKAPDGTKVTAEINGVEYAKTTTSNGQYNFNVPSDDPATPQKEGGADGDTVVFYVNGVKAGEHSFMIGGITEVKLSIAQEAIQAEKVEIRGTVASETAIAGGFDLSALPVTWTPQSFAGFYYDLTDNTGKEELTIKSIDIFARNIPKDGLSYTTSRQKKMLRVVKEAFGGNLTAAIGAGLKSTGAGQAFEGGKYDILGWQADRYAAINGRIDKLTKLILEQGAEAWDKKTLAAGEAWDLGDGWTLTAQAIDAKATPRQAWLVLSKDGVKKDDKVISEKKIYTYVEKSIAGESDVPLFVTFVDSIFAGATTDMVQLRYTWAVDTNVNIIKPGDKFGIMEVTAIDAISKMLQLKNTYTAVSLSKGSTVDLMGELKFKVADSDVLRFYPFVNYEIYEIVPPPPPPPLPPLPPPPQPFDTLRFEPNTWNLISVPKTLNNSAVDIAFANLSLDPNDIKWYYNASTNAWEHPFSILPLRGYWVYNNASSQVFQKLWYKPMAGPNVPPSMMLKAGWNLIGHTSTLPMPVSSALISIDGKYSHLLTYSPAKGWKMYIVGNPAFQQFNTFEPGRGYWLFMTQDATYAAVDI